MKARALLFIPSKLSKGIGPQLDEACSQYNIELVAESYDDYKAKLAAADNVITWGLKMPRWWYDKIGKNTLFVENGLLDQSEGVFIDPTGWFSDSSLCKERHYDESYSDSQVDRLRTICQRRFKWELFAGGDPHGPVMYALQRERDLSMYYAPKVNGFGVLESGLKILSDNCSGLPIMVRPHPREDKDCIKDYGHHFRDSWTVDGSKDVYETLRGCSGLITVNSTLATEALSLGIRVAVLGRGSFTGSGAALECHGQEERLANFRTYTVDKDKVLRYLCSVLSHQLSYRATTEDILANESFSIWADKCGGRSPDRGACKGTAYTESGVLGTFVENVAN